MVKVNPAMAEPTGLGHAYTDSDVSYWEPPDNAFQMKCCCMCEGRVLYGCLESEAMRLPVTQRALCNGFQIKHCEGLGMFVN